MRGVREHIEKLNAFNTIARQLSDVFRHGLRVAAGIDDVFRRHLAQVVAQRIPDAAARRVNQHQFWHVALAGGELRGVERLEAQIR